MDSTNKSIMGYRDDSPYRSAPYLDIFTPEGSIDMSSTGTPLYAEDETGYGKYLAPYSGMHQFPGTKVREHRMQQGGMTPAKLFKYIFDDEEQPQQQAPPPIIDNEPSQELATEEDKSMQDQSDFDAAMRILYDSDVDPGSLPRRTGGYDRNITTVPSSVLTPESYLAGIFGNEGGTTGVDPDNVPGTASGRFGIIESGRKGLYNNYYKGNMSYEEFDKKYNSDPEFEYDVAKKLAAENISQSKNAAEALGRWYAGPKAAQMMDVVPGNKFNKLTVGEYSQQALHRALKQH